MTRDTAVHFSVGGSWTNQGPSIGLDAASLLFAIVLHVPLFFLKFDANKKVVDRPTQRLVSVDLIEPELPKPVVEAPPVPVEPAKPSWAEKLKALVRREPPPPPVEKKLVEPQKLLEAPKPIELNAKLNQPEMLQPKLESKSGFQTQADPKLVQNQSLKMNGPGVIAPLSAQKLGTIENRSNLKSKDGFRVSQNEQLSGIGDGPGLAGGAAPVIALKTGKATTENFSAPTKAMANNKGSFGSAGVPSLGEPAKLGLRDSIIARDAAPGQISMDRSGGGLPGGVPGGTGTKRNAGSFQAGGGAGSGLPSAIGSNTGSAPQIAPLAVAKKREKPQMFTITGPLKDRKIEKQVAPEYPDWALAQGVSGSVVLEFTVDVNGYVKNTIVVRRSTGYPKLDDTAIKALLQWKFAPLGENREEIGQITFNYSLN